jgi:hypothetical protein
VSNPPPRSAATRSEHDAYANLLRETRGLRRDQAQARETWLFHLHVERKEDFLFELEVLLKGLACFANPRNHPGAVRRAPVIAQDYREPLLLVRDGIGRIIALCRALLPERDRSFVFQRYLETVIPDDGLRTRFVRDTMTQDAPEESLFVLRHAMANVIEVATGATRLPRVPFRLFYALLSLAQREISRSIFFNPLSALEFRPEFDRIANPQILSLMRLVPDEHARRLVALTFLSLFRMLRYLDLLEGSLLRPPEEAPRTAGAIYLVLSVLRSDARALSVYLRRRGGPLLAESYERDLLSVPAPEIVHRYEDLLGEGHRLLAIKAALDGISANVRLEMRRAFEHDLPRPESMTSFDQLRTSTRHVLANLRPALQNLVLFFGKALGARLEEHGVFDDEAARRVLSDRLRRDVWMFAQIVRAVTQKMRAVSHQGEGWGGASRLGFVSEFLVYFRAMGYPLLRASDYPRVDAFLTAMTALADDDLLDPVRLGAALEECERFHAFLSELFEKIGQRGELRGTNFDRRSAAEALRLYLGD